MIADENDFVFIKFESKLRVQMQWKGKSFDVRYQTQENWKPCMIGLNLLSQIVVN